MTTPSWSNGRREQSTRTVFTPIDPATKTAQSVEEVIEKIPIVVEAEEIISESSAEETVTPVESPEDPSTSDTLPIVEDAVVGSEEPSEEQSAAVETAVETEATTPTPDGPQLTLEEAAEHFQKTHAENEVEEAGLEITLPGRIALHESSPQLHDLLIKTLQELDRFPLPLAQVIGKELSGSGLQIFKAHKKIIHVSVARPRYLDRATTPTSEGFRGILDYLEAHPKQPRDKQWAGMLALRTEPTGEDAGALKQREQALGTDLLWLLHQGHVLDFAMGNLQATLRPVPQQKPAQSSAPATKESSENPIPEEHDPASAIAEITAVEEEEMIAEPSSDSETLPEVPVAISEPSALSELSTEPKPPLPS